MVFKGKLTYYKSTNLGILPVTRITARSFHFRHALYIFLCAIVLFIMKVSEVTVHKKYGKAYALRKNSRALLEPQESENRLSFNMEIRSYSY